MNTSLASKIPYLKDRAHMLRQARVFFDTLGVLEVDCPLLSPAAPVDEHIDILKVCSSHHQNGYLHSSTEYGMKRLLSAGIGDIYQIAHVFRDGEVSPLHNPEFTMVEWYRLGVDFDAMIAETLDFIRLFLGDLSMKRLSYRETFQQFLGVDYCNVSQSELIDCAQRHALDLPSDTSSWKKETLLQLLLSFLIEPQLGSQDLFVLSHYPHTQAALAKTLVTTEGEQVGCRFEVYYKGIELCNGYHELTDPVEQRKRFERSNAARLCAGKDKLPIDERFLGALESGLPDCCGVAVGFDRLMMLRHHLSSLQNVIPMTWEES